MSDYPPAMPPYDPPGSSGPSPYGPQREHPQATTALVLGILGLVLCQVLAPFAWFIGGRAVRDIDASGGSIGGRGSANAGRILGIVGSVIGALGVLVGAVLLVGLLVGAGTVHSESDTTCTQVGPDGVVTGC